MKATQKAYRILLLTVFVLVPLGLATAQDRVLVPSTATGGFGESNACHTGMVPALNLSGPQTVIINAAGRIKFGSPSYEVPPNGITLGSNKNLGALVGAFVEKARASDPAFQPLSEALTGWGIPASSLFLIGNGPYKFEAPAAGTLFLGINAGDVCRSTGSFAVSAYVPVKIATVPARALLTIHTAKPDVIALVIIGSNSFDARKVHPASLRLTAGPILGASDPESCRATDTNADGLTDLVCQFRVDGLATAPGTVRAALEGRTTDGMPIRAEMPVTVAP